MDRITENGPVDISVVVLCSFAQNLRDNSTIHSRCPTRSGTGPPFGCRWSWRSLSSSCSKLTTKLAVTTTCGRCMWSSEHPSGCADGKTDGLADYEEVQACSGRWQGHVKRARTLCAGGWQVCSPRHSSALTLLTWNDLTRLPGCYAYNAANTLSLCSVYVIHIFTLLASATSTQKVWIILGPQ